MKQIKEYPEYLISLEGKVFRNNKELKPVITNSGYYRISLYNNGNSKSYTIHRLVALNYINNPKNLRFVNHKDGNKLNNHVNNLEWISNSDNLKHAYKLNLKSAKGENNGRCKHTDSIIESIRVDFKNGIKRKELSIKYNISYSHIVSIIANKRR